MNSFALCTVPVAPLRKENNHRSEMVSQLLFGESMEILEEKEEWLKIRTHLDHYEGWLTKHLVEEVSSDFLQQPSHIASSLFNQVHSNTGNFYLPMGSILVNFKEGKNTFWKDWKFEGKFEPISHQKNHQQLDQLCRQWLRSPYLWGGKTCMGVDCSGFVQTVFRVMGFLLPRDAWQQAKEGTIAEESDWQKGDVAFFQNEQGKITHVGILLSHNSIIHASGEVRIDPFSKEGILHSLTGKKTHTFHSVKRMME